MGASGVRTPASRRTSLVPDAAYRHHDLRVLWVCLDLRTQPLDVDVDQSSVGGVTVSPHLLKQLLAGEHLPRLAREGYQQVELEWRERDLLSGALDGVPRHVDDEVGNLERLRPPLVSTSHTGADPRDQLFGLERLHDVVVSPGF